MTAQGLTPELIAVRVARELKDGMYVNLGYGLPTMVSRFLPPDQDIVLHAENGVLGFGSHVFEEQLWDSDLIDAGSLPVTLNKGGCFFDLGTSFVMVRGGRLDISVLGAYQVSEEGDLANWTQRRQAVGGIGGAMELAVGAKRVIVAMHHTSESGEPKLVKKCTYPLTARRVVNTIVTDLAYIEVTLEGFLLKEVAPGVTPEDVQRASEARLIISQDLREMDL